MYSFVDFFFSMLGIRGWSGRCGIGDCVVVIEECYWDRSDAWGLEWFYEVFLEVLWGEL